MDREKILEETDEAYRRLRNDPIAWAEIQAERKLWETTLMDDLEEDPYPDV